MRRASRARRSPSSTPLRGAPRGWPRQLLATRTHDTKRSEDVRARLRLLSEIPDRWAAAVRRWRELAERHRAAPGPPDPALEYLLYQALVGAAPAARRPGRRPTWRRRRGRPSAHTSWIEPDAAYERRRRRLVRRGVHGDAAFAEDLAAFVAPLVEPGPGQRRSRSAREAHRARRARHLPGHRAAGTSAWSTPTTAGPSTTTSVAGSLAEARRGRRRGRVGGPRRGPDQARGCCSAPCAVRRRTPTPFGPAGGVVHAAGALGRRADHVVGFAPGRTASSPSCPAWSSASAVERWVADTHRRRCPAGRWRDALTGARRRRRRPAGGPARRLPGRAPRGRGERDSRSRRWAPPRRAPSRWSWATAAGAHRGAVRRRRRWAGGAGPAPATTPAAADVADAGPRPSTASSSTADRPARPPLAVAAAPASTARPARSTPPPSRGPTPAGRGVHLPSAVIYELHVGTFTPEGTFDGAIERPRPPGRARRHRRRAHARRPVPGATGLGLRRRRARRAPPRLRRPRRPASRLVDACHARGLGVVLDVVYNHLGPPGTTSAASGPTSPTATPRRGATR